MKTKMLFLTAVFFVVTYTGIAQVPEGFNYQAVVRDATGAVLINQTIPVKIALLANSPTGPMFWEEQHTVISNQFGLISLVLGTGTRTGGTIASFSSIDWSAQTVYIRTSLQYPGTTWNTITNTHTTCTHDGSWIGGLYGFPTDMCAAGVGGFEPDRRSFRAHLTLARKVRRELPASVVEPVTWPATELSLVESTTLPSGSRQCSAGLLTRAQSLGMSSRSG